MSFHLQFFECEGFKSLWVRHNYIGLKCHVGLLLLRNSLVTVRENNKALNKVLGVKLSKGISYYGHLDLIQNLNHMYLIAHFICVFSNH